jgi:hypothetical protein
MAKPPPMPPLCRSVYFNMILAVYFVLGMYTYKAGANPAANKTFIGFIIWSSLAHVMVMIIAVITDDTPSYAGPAMGFDIPARIFGIAHWQNISPLGDVPLLALFAFGDLFLAYKAFGSFLSPMDTIA